MNKMIAVSVWICFMFFCAAPSFAMDKPVIHGFVENAFGARLSDDDDLAKHRRYNMFEQRLQLKSRYVLNDNVLNFKSDFFVDEYYGGKTGADIREANLAFSPADFMDIKLGRQTLTWGTGDYLFINDVFPKDYVSFYIGRDDEYLKKPSDALRISMYPAAVNIDLAIIGPFEPNTLPKGSRLSFFDSFQQGIAGRNSQLKLTEPGRQIKNFQYGLRLYRNFGSNEAALYFFRGFDQSPRSYLNEAANELFYERLDVYGFSLRGPFLGGIANIETGYCHSPQDEKGDNRLIENSSFKNLIGYEKDLGNDLKVGFQYLYERKLDYGNYSSALLAQDYFWDETRHLLTQRVTKLYKNQTVQAGLFNFYSPSDRDGYFRASVSYAITDQWKFSAGANVPWGEDDITDFGQMKKNKNIYIRTRCTF